MKNIRIFPKDWLQLHPYKQSGPTDLYYTNIANRIYDFMEQTKLAGSFEKEDTVQICIRLAAHFEDIISGLNIWPAFVTAHKEVTGKQLPFYTPDDHYYEDEVNLEDIRFLLWHYTQQYHGLQRSTLVSPDNEAGEKTARLIYQLFSDEWTTAPENEKMQKLFSPETRYEDTDSYNNLLYWFHYDSYLFTDSKKEMQETAKEYWGQNQGTDNGQAIMIIHDSLAHISKTAFMAYTSPKWLSLILPDNHPDHGKFVEEGEKTQLFTDPNLVANQEAFKAHYDKFTAAANGRLLIYMHSKQEFLDFLTNDLGLNNEENVTEDTSVKKFAVYATPTEGLQILKDGIEYIKDEHNPFYDEKEANDQAVAFFVIKHCSPYLLKELEERGMLADAQAKSLLGPERSKAIVHENWQFLSRYFLREF